MRAIIANVITPAKNFNNELSQTICEPFSSPADFMAGAGIVVRNSIILVDFIEMRLAEGHPLAKAVVEAAMIRFRPIMLTALAVVAGATVILADPIFQGLAIALTAGSLISMFTAPVAVPLLYFMAYNREPKAARESSSTDGGPSSSFHPGNLK